MLLESSDQVPNIEDEALSVFILIQKKTKKFIVLLMPMFVHFLKGQIEAHDGYFQSVKRFMENQKVYSV